MEVETLWREAGRSGGLNRRQFLRSTGIAGGAILAGAAPVRTFLRGEEVAAVAAGSTTITLWTSAGPRFGLANDALIKAFQQAHPDIQVRMVTTPIGDYFPKVATEIGGDTDAYDVITAIPTFVVAFAKNGKIADLDPSMTATEKADLVKDIPRRYLETWTYNGHLYAIPNDANCQLTFYRKDLFEAAGVKLPATWEGVPAAAKALTKNGIYGYTASLRRGEYAGAHFSSVMWSYGGEWWDSDFHPTIDSEAGRRALDVMLACMPYADPGSINATEDDTINAIASGTAAYAPLLWGTSALTNPKLNSHAAQTLAAVPPAGGGHRPAPIMGGQAYMIPARAKNKDAAVAYIKFATSREAMSAFVRATGQPARVSALTDPENVKFAPYFPALGAALRLAHPQVRVTESFQLLDFLGNEVALVLTKQKSAPQGLRDIQKGFLDVLKKGNYVK
jgi:ABC-type glycerol-3-phosphate transport system substrate-binding protein